MDFLVYFLYICIILLHMEIPTQSAPPVPIESDPPGLENEILNRIQAGAVFRPYSLHFLFR